MTLPQPAGTAEFYSGALRREQEERPRVSRAPSPGRSAGFKAFIKEPSFNKRADRRAAEQPRVPEEVSLLILPILVISHGIASNASTHTTRRSPAGHRMLTLMDWSWGDAIELRPMGRAC